MTATVQLYRIMLSPCATSAYFAALAPSRASRQGRCPAICRSPFGDLGEEEDLSRRLERRKPFDPESSVRARLCTSALPSQRWAADAASLIRAMSEQRREERKNRQNRATANRPHVPRSTESAAIQLVRDQLFRGRYLRQENTGLSCPASEARALELPAMHGQDRHHRARWR